MGKRGTEDLIDEGADHFGVQLRNRKKARGGDGEKGKGYRMLATGRLPSGEILWAKSIFWSLPQTL